MAQKRITDLDAATALTGGELIEVSQLSTAVKITAATISAAAADNSLNDSAAGFIAAGFSVGDRVKVQGFATGANNALVATVATLAAGKVTLTLPDGAALVDEAAGPSVKVTKWTSARVSAGSLAGSAKESFVIALGDETTAITAGNGKVTFRMPYAFTLTEVRASLNVASSSGIPTIDINEGGASILSTKLTIDATEKTSKTAAVPAVISDANLADDAELTFDIDVAGTGAAGLKVVLIGNKA